MILMFIDASARGSAGQKCKYKNYLYKHAVSHQKKKKKLLSFVHGLCGWDRWTGKLGPILH